MKANKICLICKKRIQAGQNIAIQKNGIVIHVDKCLKKLKDDVQSIQQKKDS